MKHCWRIPVEKPEFFQYIVSKGKSEEIFAWQELGQILVLKPKKMFGIIPIRGQLPFVGHVRKKKNGMMFAGRFSFPMSNWLFYLAFLVFGALQLGRGSETWWSDVGGVFVIGCALVFYLLVIMNRILFRKQNREVLVFLDTMIKELNNNITTE